MQEFAFYAMKILICGYSKWKPETCLDSVRFSNGVVALRAGSHCGGGKLCQS